MRHPRATSTARLYFDDIRGQPDPCAYLSSFLSPPRADPFFEEEWIDFKGNPASDGDTKKIWSKALSGFANITDGLIVWGIDARKTPPRDIDAASGLRLVPDPHALESKLRDYIRDATNPPVLGVEYQSYPGLTGEGFVVCLVPESSHKPHRAEWADRHYYYRAGDDFLIAEPGLLRTLFYPQHHPQIVATVTLSYRLEPQELAQYYRQTPDPVVLNQLLNGHPWLTLEVTLDNRGPATAKDMFVVVQTDAALNYHPGDDWSARGWHLQGPAALQARRPFHPGETIRLFHASFQQLFANRPLNESQPWTIIPHFEKLSFGFLIFAEGAEPQELVVEFVPEEFELEHQSGVAGKVIKVAIPVG